MTIDEADGGEGSVAATTDGPGTGARTVWSLSPMARALTWVRHKRMVRWVTIIAVVVLSFASGVTYGPILWAGEPSSSTPAATLYEPGKPMAGDTDAVLSLQIEDHGSDPYHRCTATLIDNPLTTADDSAGDWALTTAHCVTPVPAQIAQHHDQRAVACGDEQDTDIPSATRFDPQTAPFVVRGATTVYTHGGQTAPVTHRYIAPGWNWARTPGTPTDDLALLHLGHPLTITPIPLATTEPPPGAFGVVYGWSVGIGPGCTTTISPDLQQFPVRIDPCPDGPETSKEVCAGTPNDSAGPCDGVSGGPIVSLDTNEHPTLHGVYSTDLGDYCGQGTMFFTSVTPYSQWLLSVMSSPR